jgi:hypothetical protein
MWISKVVILGSVTLPFSVVYSDGLNCYHKIGELCKSGYASGYQSDCKTPCNTGLKSTAGDTHLQATNDKRKGHTKTKEGAATETHSQ